ncbi:hypothetical protein LX36DRAFT_103488 [Colletotrichum falcatum]|nr:hypothetical protein LX36DRAFT_103488 [Colletotrichum falcatum]
MLPRALQCPIALLRSCRPWPGKWKRLHAAYFMMVRWAPRRLATLRRQVSGRPILDKCSTSSSLCNDRTENISEIYPNRNERIPCNIHSVPCDAASPAVPTYATKPVMFRFDFSSEYPVPPFGWALG